MNNLIAAALLGSLPPAAPASTEPRAMEDQRRSEGEVICRRRLISSERVGERFRRQEVCMTREERDAGRQRRR